MHKHLEVSLPNGNILSDMRDKNTQLCGDIIHLHPDLEIGGSGHVTKSHLL